jgi:hypothetical protein
VKVDVTVSPFDRQADDDDDERRPVERAIEELVYEHLVDLVNFDRMWQLEQVVALRIGDLVDSRDLPFMTDDAIADRAGELIARAWHRLIEDPRRYATFGGEWVADDNCELCQALAEQPEHPDAVNGTPRSHKGSKS